MEDAKRRKLNADEATDTATAADTATPTKKGDTVEDPGSTVDDVIAAVSEAAAAAEAANEDDAGKNPQNSPQVAKKDDLPVDATTGKGRSLWSFAFA